MSRKPTLDDIDTIESVTDQIGLCTSKLTRILKEIDNETSRRALKTWVAAIDAAIANGPDFDGIDANTSDTTDAFRNEVRS